MYIFIKFTICFEFFFQILIAHFINILRNHVMRLHECVLENQKHTL